MKQRLTLIIHTKTDETNVKGAEKMRGEKRLGKEYICLVLTKKNF